MHNNSFKSWSFTLALLLASSCLEAASQFATKQDSPPNTTVSGLDKISFYIAVLNGRVGYDDKTGRAFLEKHAAAGDQDAQECLYTAAVEGKLGFDNNTGRKYLEEHAAAGDKEAQSQLYHAAMHDKLGFTEETGIDYIIGHATAGNKDAQDTLTMLSNLSRISENERKKIRKALDQCNQKGG